MLPPPMKNRAHRGVSVAARRLARVSRGSAEIIATVSARVVESRLGETAAAGTAVAQEVCDSALLLAKGTTPSPSPNRWRTIADAALSANDPSLQEMLTAVVTHYASGIVGNFSPAMHRVVTAIAPPAICSLFRPKGRDDDKRPRLEFEGPLAALRELACESTLLFVPTHSSSLDPFVFGVALAMGQLPPCAYAGGKHMYRKTLIRVLATGVGGYTVDRAIRLPLYIDTLKEFSTLLLERGVHSVVFAGATRCRSNQIETELKLGLLSTALRAARNLRSAGTPRPIHVVPVTMNYQVVPEASVLIRFFLQGRAKERIFDEPSKEPGGLLRLVRRVLALDGSIVIRYGAPIRAESRDPSAEAAEVRKLGAEITAAHWRETVFMDTHVTARALYDLTLSRLANAPTPIEFVTQVGADVFEFTADEVSASVLATTALIAAQPEHGHVHHRVCDRAPLKIVAGALQSWRSCHESQVVARVEDRYRVADAALLLYYRNRTSHLLSSPRSES
jgi:glycerol-3-phosphate O-acyltransferase